METLASRILALGAHRAEQIAVREVPFDASFRALCASNACGNYGRCWMCPPDAGDIDALIAHAKTFENAVVYQTVGTLEDSYDFEGMMEAGARQYALAQKVRTLCETLPLRAVLHLGAGGCRVCPTCAKRTNEPCRFPGKAMSSLETYGVNVSALAACCGMKYIHGPDTVTYFGAVLFSEAHDG